MPVAMNLNVLSGMNPAMIVHVGTDRGAFLAHTFVVAAAPR